VLVRCGAIDHLPVGIHFLLVLSLHARSSLLGLDGIEVYTQSTRSDCKCPER
jgi:hypothetical protein